MGYYLHISDEQNSVCGGKLYGYISNEEFDTLESVNYLIRIGKIKYEERFDYNIWWLCPEPIVLNANQFRAFIILYLNDLQAPIHEEQILADGVPIFGIELIDLYHSTTEKTISWG